MFHISKCGFTFKDSKIDLLDNAATVKKKIGKVFRFDFIIII